MRSPARIESLLHVCFGGILASVAGASVTGCFGGGNCDAPPAEMFDVTFTLCSSIDAGQDARAKGGVDAGVGSSADGGSGDAGACFTSCNEACSTLEPVDLGGRIGICESAEHAGRHVMTAHCEAVVQCLGRRFDGLAAPEIVAGNPSGAWLAQAAWLEAASVHAFRRLARELEAHGAPRTLVLRAKACAKDESRHARMMVALAKKRRIAVPRVAAPRSGERDLESVARENAIEGCVGETYGALHAAWLASHETDGDVAAAMAAIAPDELRHAALGWAVAEWIDAKLTRAQRERVRRARTDAAREIVLHARTREERTLAEGLMQRLWAA